MTSRFFISPLLALIVIVGCVERRPVVNRQEREHLETNVKSVASINADSTDAKIEMTTYYMGFLRKGPKWTADPTPEVLKIQDAHMAHINQMAKEGTLILAGPFLGQEGPNALAGMFLFKVDSEAKAKELADADPGIQSGRFVIEIVPWLGPATLNYK